MSWHCDHKYSKLGKFVKSTNSQVQNTVTIILSLGDERILNWRRRKLIKNKNGNMIWEIDKSWVGSMTMNKYGMVILNPFDEQPHIIDDCGNYYQYQHGDVHISGDSMSIGLVFRVVDEYYYYNSVSNRMINHNISQKLNSKDLDDQHKRLCLYKNFDKAKYHELMLKIYYWVIDKN